LNAIRADVEFGRRVRKIRGNRTQKEFAKAVGTSQGNVSKMERGMVPEVDILLGISRYAGATVEYLVTGEAGGGVVGHHEKNLPDAFSLIEKVKGAGSAGRGLAPDDTVDIRLAFRDDWLSRFGGPDRLVALMIEGDSMEPTLSDGDVVVINKNSNRIRPGGGIYSLVWNGKRMIKRLQLNPRTGKVLIKSDNPRYDALEAVQKDLRVEGQLIWYGRELK